MGQGGGDGTGAEISARAEKLCTDAVTHVFLTLCGKSDAPDKFTGMQREMNLYIKGIIQAAIDAGQEAGRKELAREQYRATKAMEQLVDSYKAKAKESEDRRVAGLVARVDKMCNSLEAQKEEFQRNLKEFERTMLVMKERAALHEKQGKDWAEQMIALRKQGDEALAQAECAAREADKERRAAVILRDQAEKLEKMLAEEQAERLNVGQRWSKDVEMMQKQLQNEVAARIAADERLRESKEACRRSARDAEEAACFSTSKAAAGATSKCAECCARDELLQELQAAVALLNDQLSSAYREKAAAEKERERQHAKALAAVREDMASQLSAARDAQAFAEKVAKRLEHELSQQSKAIVSQQQQARGQQASGLKRRTAAGKQHPEFKDFSADVERLTGGAKSKSAGNAQIQNDGAGAATELQQSCNRAAVGSGAAHAEYAETPRKQRDEREEKREEREEKRAPNTERRERREEREEDGTRRNGHTHKAHNLRAASTQVPAMPLISAHAPPGLPPAVASTLARPSSARPADTACRAVACSGSSSLGVPPHLAAGRSEHGCSGSSSLGVPSQGGSVGVDARLGEIRKPTPPIGGGGGAVGSGGGRKISPLNLSAFECGGGGGAGGGSGVDGAVTERGGGGSGFGVRKLPPRHVLGGKDLKTAYTAR